jgi:phosphoglycerol transferase
VPLDGVAVLVVAATLLGTVGGFGTVIALGFTQIRAYARISVFLAFFALLAVAMFFDWLVARTKRSTAGWLGIVLAAALVFVGIFDQTTATMVPAYAQTQTEWVATSAFVSSVEATLPDNAEVFQLPYVPFPENPPVVKMLDYDHFKPYLVGHKIHWSYGAVKGRENAAWDASAAALPADQMVAQLKAKGFAGVWVDRFGYEDGGSAIDQQLAQVTGTTPKLSADGRYAFFALGK